jgi:hypothetical protein
MCVGRPHADASAAATGGVAGPEISAVQQIHADRAVHVCGIRVHTKATAAAKGGARTAPDTHMPTQSYQHHALLGV